MPELNAEWTLCCTPPGAAPAPSALIDRDWYAAPVPGTAAEALRAAGLWQLEDPAPLHDRDVWYRLHAPPLGAGTLLCEGLATHAEVWDGDMLLHRSCTMYSTTDLPVTIENSLHLCFRALEPIMATATGPRARWRTQLVQDRRLRLVRTTLLGHLPPWCPAVHAVGPWRPLSFVPAGSVYVRSSNVIARMDGGDGVVVAAFSIGGMPDGTPLRLQVGPVVGPVSRDPGSVRVSVPTPGQWWPHTHGAPTLYPTTLHVGHHRIELPPVGFRTITLGSDMAVHVNGVPVFCRGAVWITPDIVRLGGDPLPSLTRLRDAGLNMVRVSGVGHYQDCAFHAACDRLGILVWQDLMFANMDYPTTDPAFVERALDEVAWALAPCGPSLAIVCGGSEVAQQAAMLGLPATTWRSAFYTDSLACAVARARPDVAYVPNSPWGTGWPFAPAGGGPTHYFGVGAYRRPITDAWTAGVRFASECLAFSHVPDDYTADPWAGPPRDPGAPWDFADVRDHYTALLFGIDPAALRIADPDRALLLARATSSELLQEVVAGWRGRGVNQGALVWHWADFVPGAGWGVIDATGRPKAAWHGLRQAASPVLLVLLDEGLSGLAAAIVNDTEVPRTFVLRIRCLRDGAVTVAQANMPVRAAARAITTIAPATLFPEFFDVTYAYRFGPPAHDVTTAWLEEDGAVVARAHHYPRGRDALNPAALTASLVSDGTGWAVDVTADRFAVGVHLQDAEWMTDGDWCAVPPGVSHRMVLRGGTAPPGGTVRAVNAAPVSYGAAPCRL